MPVKDYITVSELNYYISNIFSEEELLHNVPVVGEVSGCSVVGGHCYFVLKDKTAQIKIVYYNCPPSMAPKNGAQVLVRGCVDYYAKGGQLNVKAYEIKPFGIGQLYEQLELLKKKLDDEGLFREDHKKEIPPYPKRVALITSTKGAAMQDFLTTTLKKNKITDISVIDVRVQGDYAANDIRTALINADEYGFDIIIIARGGGSFEDLYCFNDEQLVRTIYDAKTPIISAVGHETDYTLCDFVADYRAITPTAAAEKIAFDSSAMKNEILNLVEEIAYLAGDKIKEKQNLVSAYAEKIKNKAVFLLREQVGTIRNCLFLAQNSMDRKFERKSTEIALLLQRIDDCNPTKLLKKGYFRIVKQGKDIRSSQKIAIGDTIEIIAEKEKMTAIVQNKEPLCNTKKP